jgi:hypothetical protein
MEIKIIHNRFSYLGGLMIEECGIGLNVVISWTGIESDTFRWDIWGWG